MLAAAEVFVLFTVGVGVGVGGGRTRPGRHTLHRGQGRRSQHCKNTQRGELLSLLAVKRQ
jgi:hypothetical protein